MNSKYVDIPSTIQVIGNIFNNPKLLDNEKYTFYEEDFPNDFHKIIFGSIYNLYVMGAKDLLLMDFIKLIKEENIIKN